MTSPSTDGASSHHRVVVVGGGFGGLHSVRALRRAPVEITLVDRRNYHLFQPLVYQVATGALSPGEIAVPLRHIFRRAGNVRVVLAEVTRIDLHGRHLVYRPADDDRGDDRHTLAYDSLIVAAGSSYSYFGRDEWGTLAPSVKSIEDAIEVRRRIPAAFEAAEIGTDPARKQALLTFAVVGAGPTGVELAGQIGELARDALPRDFRSIDTRAATILLVDQVDRVLPTFPLALSTRAARMLEDLGVTPLLGHTVVAVDPAGLTLTDAAANSIHLPARTVIWAAGVHASELAATLADEAGTHIDRAGRVAVGPDLTLPAHPEVFVIDDMAQVCDASGAPAPLPGVAPVAMQQGRYAARVISETRGIRAHTGRLVLVNVVTPPPTPADHARGAAPWPQRGEAGADPAALVRAEHAEIRPHLEYLRTLAEDVATADEATLRQRLEHVLTFLRTGVLAHAEVEEATVYPAAERLLRAIGGATDTMTLEHEQIRAHVDELERIAAEEPDSEALRSRIARSLAALEALLRAHFDKEEEVYLPLLAHLTPAEASALANALEMAAPGGHHH